MRTRVFASLLVAGSLFMGPANAAIATRPPQKNAVLFSISGEGQGTTAAKSEAVGWSFSYPMRNVSIAARLSNGGGFAGGTAYLMRAVGPGTTTQGEVARTTVDLPLGFYDNVPLFTDLDLAAGDYWLVFEVPKTGPFSYLNWDISQPVQLQQRAGVRYLGTKILTVYDSDYAPAAPFGEANTGFGYQIEITVSPERPASHWRER